MQLVKCLEDNSESIGMRGSSSLNWAMRRRGTAIGRKVVVSALALSQRQQARCNLKLAGRARTDLRKGDRRRLGTGAKDNNAKEQEG